jgi:cytoskeletal protein RodZ
MTIEGLGKKFQEARLARGLTLDEAARLTKIRPSRLAEIEADDFSQFPSLAYAKGFLLIYGKFLDVDVSPYLDVFETSEQMTVDGYSYLQDQPVPRPPRVHARARARTRVIRQSGNRTSPLPIVIAIIAIGIGFVLMRLILDIQRIAPRSEQMVGVPQPSATATPSVAPPMTPIPTAAPRARVAEAPPKKVAPPPPTAAPSAAPVATSPPVVAKATVVPTATPATKEPEVRRAEPVRPEDLAKAGVTQNAAQPSGPNNVAIKPLKKTYIKVVVDNETLTPAFERWISPTDGPVEFHGQHIAVRVLDREAIQIKKNGKPIAEGDTDVTVE